MIRRLAPLATLLVVTVAPLPAQLGMITVPYGAFRVDLSGAFYPNDEVWVNGARRPLGSFVDGTANPIVRALQSNLGALIGQPVTGLSLGGVTAIASRDHGVGNIGFSFGLTPRITIFGSVPIVYRRSRIKTAFDPSTSRVGINPANKKLGTLGGADSATTFFTQFDLTIDSLRARVQKNFYTGTAAALAAQSIVNATSMRKALGALLVDSISASAVLPTASDPAAQQILARIAALQSTLNTDLALPNFSALPEFPTATLSSADFDNLLNEPTGLGLASPNNLPEWGLGDMSAGVAVELLRHGTAGDGSWSSAWLRATGHFPNASAADPGILLDQASGAKRKSIQLDGIVEFGTRTGGIRAEASYLHGLPANALTRPASPEDLLVPPSFLAAVTTRPGDSIALAIRPWISFAPHLALSGMVQYWRRGMSSTEYLTGQLPIANVDPAQLDIGTAANALVISVGFSYYHNGRGRDGTVSLPIEAGWSIERTVSTSDGIFPVSLTSRVYLKLSRPLIKH